MNKRRYGWSDRLVITGKFKQSFTALVAVTLLFFWTSPAVAMELIGKATLSAQDQTSMSAPVDVHLMLTKRTGARCGIGDMLDRGERVSLYLRGIRATGQPTGVYRVLLGSENSRPSAAVGVGEINFYGITSASSRDVSFFIDPGLLGRTLEATTHCSVRVLFVPTRITSARPEFAIDSIELWAGPMDSPNTD